MNPAETTTIHESPESSPLLTIEGEVLQEFDPEDRLKLLGQIDQLVASFRENLRWERYTTELSSDILRRVEVGSLVLGYAFEGPVADDVLMDPNFVKIEAGGEADSSRFIFEHRMSPEKPLVPHTTQQIVYASSQDPEAFSESLAEKKIALGDIDLGGTLSYWLIKRAQMGEDLSQYKELTDMVAKYDLQGRPAIYPEAEPTSSLFRCAWGIEMSTVGKVDKLAAYESLFDRIADGEEDVTEEIPWVSSEVVESIESLIEFSVRAVDEAIASGNLGENTLLLEDIPYDRAHWDEVSVQVVHRLKGSRVALISSPTESPDTPVMLANAFSSYYLAPLGEQMAEEGLPVWYGSGFVGIDTRNLSEDQHFSVGDMQARLEGYIADCKEGIAGAVEFEVVFDDRDYLESVAQEAIGQVITGYTKSPEYNKITSAYLWNEYGQGLEEGEVHTNINFDEVLVLRFLVSANMKQKTYDYFYDRMGEKWDTPLIKMTEMQVPRKFAEYTEDNVAQSPSDSAIEALVDEG